MKKLPTEVVKRRTYVDLIRGDANATKVIFATYAESHLRFEGESDDDYLSRCAEQDYEDGEDACCFPEYFVKVQSMVHLDNVAGDEVGYAIDNQNPRMRP